MQAMRIMKHIGSSVGAAVLCAAMLGVLFAACATTEPTAHEEQKPSESQILSLKNVTLDGENSITSQMFYVYTGDNDRREPIANRTFIIFVYYDGEHWGEIRGKTDENGWVYVKHIPDGNYYFLFTEQYEDATE